MMPDLLCMGEPLLELAARPPGAEGRIMYLQGFGGDASNAAIAAARQGANVGMLTALGQDFAGDAFLALWQREGLDCTHVLRDPAHPTGVYFITHDREGHRFFYLRRDSAAAWYGTTDLPEEAIRHARILYASGIGLAISTRAADAIFRAIGLAHEHNVTVAIDPNYRPALWPRARAAALIHAAIAEADIALPTLEEATNLCGLAVPDAILDFYLRLGPKIVILKLGATGAMLATPATRQMIPALEVKTLDTTGAGDVLTGSFLARILAGDEPETAARYAIAAASLSTREFGAVAPIPRTREVRAALGQR